MNRFLLCAALLFSISPLPAFADAHATRLRLLAQKHASSVVTVAVVIGTNMSSDQTEIEASGLVIDASGLVVLPNAAIDPFSLRDDTQGVISNVTGARILLSGGVEVPARVVLRDKDRNLAFVRPLRPFPASIRALPFAAARASAAQGEEVTLVGRLGKAGGRVVSVETTRLIAVMTRPRRLLVMPIDMLAHLGEAAFDERGELLGLVSLRIISSRGNSFSQTDRYIAAIVPAADVWAVARQVPRLKNTAFPAASSTKPAAIKSGAKAATSHQ